jgi:tRNA(fMet)-specific endonuclease VapC
MAGSSMLLDTVIIAGILNGESALLERLQGSLVRLSSIVIGELFYGAFHSGRVNENLIRLRQFTAQYPVMPCDVETSEIYGEIKAALRKKGRPIPENDIWIAAVAKQHELVLATRDAHFREIDQLTVVYW